MINKGDTVLFVSGDDSIYLAASDTYERDGELVVELHGYAGEVAIKYLAKIHSLFGGDV